MAALTVFLNPASIITGRGSNQRRSQANHWMEDALAGTNLFPETLKKVPSPDGKSIYCVLKTEAVLQDVVNALQSKCVKVEIQDGDAYKQRVRNDEELKARREAQLKSLPGAAQTMECLSELNRIRGVGGSTALGPLVSKIHRGTRH